MHPFITYHLESSLIIAVFYLFYRLLLRNETFFRTNRYVLLSAIPIAYIIPLIDIPIQSSGPVAGIPVVTLPAINLAPATTVQAEAATSTSPLLYLYILGATLLVGHALYGFFSIYRLRRKAQANHNKKQETYYIHKGDSFSFFRMVFLNTENKSENELKQIEAHERVHVEEYHSVDALLIHLAIIFQWFNPFVWLMKHAIFENHEFIADRETSRNASEYSYQDLLLRQAAGIPLSSLVHPFNKISLKRRFKMLLIKKSSKIKLLKYLLLIPISGSLFWFISTSNGMESNLSFESIMVNDTIYKEVDVAPKYKGGKEALDAHLKKHLVYPEEARKNNIKVMVGAGFVVNKDGSVSDINLHKNPGYGIDQVVKNTLSNMEWIPGQKNDEKVRTKMFMPIMFSPDNDPYSMLESGSAQPVFSDIKLISKEKDAQKPKKENPRIKGVHILVDERPEFKGGEAAQMEYMSKHIDYPEDAKKDSIQGTVYVQFVVEKDGSISNVRLLRGFHESCDQEALKTIRNMPAWEPGKKDGKPVRTQFNMPIKFTLDK